MLQLVCYMVSTCDQQTHSKVCHQSQLTQNVKVFFTQFFNPCSKTVVTHQSSIWPSNQDKRLPMQSTKSQQGVLSLVQVEGFSGTMWLDNSYHSGRVSAVFWYMGICTVVNFQGWLGENRWNWPKQVYFLRCIRCSEVNGFFFFSCKRTAGHESVCVATLNLISCDLLGPSQPFVLYPFVHGS